MTVSNFIALCLEPSMQKVELWSYEENAAIFQGTLSELVTTDYRKMEIQSFDALDNGNDTLTLNV